SNTQTVTISPAVTENAVSADGKPITAISSANTSGAGLPTAVANAGNNSLVVLQGTFNTTATTTLQTGQTVMGSGSLPVTTSSGRTVTIALPGGATIAGTASTAITMSNNSTISGMTITNTSGGASAGVTANSVTGATISNNTISATSTGNAANAVSMIG